MKKFLGFIVFFGFLGFCWLAFGAVDARDSKELSAKLNKTREQLVLREKQIESLISKSDKLQAELNELKPSEETETEEENTDATG